MLSRRSIRVISHFLIVALLAAQGLLAAHACDKMGALPKAMATATSAQVDAMTGEGDAAVVQEGCCAPTPLCHDHCKNDPGTTDSTHAVAIADFFAIFCVAIAAPDSPVATAAPHEPALAHATSPPAAIRHCCWRI